MADPFFNIREERSVLEREQEGLVRWSPTGQTAAPQGTGDRGSTQPSD